MAGRIQAYPDFDSVEPFIRTTDWSSLNIEGVLSQKQDGVERFQGCWGQKCNWYERHYSSAKGELLALVKCMKKWEHILKYLPPFLVYRDAASLKYNVNLKSEETIFQHWYAELAQFEFIVIHKKGSENVNADALSRAKHLDEPTAEENEEYQEANKVGEMKINFASELEVNPVEIGKERRKFAGYPHAIHNLSNETKFEIMEGNVLRKLQEGNEVWKEVIKWIIDGTQDAGSEGRNTGSDISEADIQSYLVCAT